MDTYTDEELKKIINRTKTCEHPGFPGFGLEHSALLAQLILDVRALKNLTQYQEIKAAAQRARDLTRR